MTGEIIPEDFRGEGIYFGLPAFEYHASPALGSTNLGELLFDPIEFHWRWAGNPNRANDVDTEALTFGRALHANVLLGKRAMEQEFMLEPDEKQFPGLLSLKEDLAKWLGERGLNKSGNKPDLIKRVRDVDKKIPIYDELVGEAKRLKKRLLKPEQWERIAIASKHITGNPVLAESFRGGYSEVSIFWTTKEGVRCKARYDYVKVVRDHEQKRLAVISDLKSFAPAWTSRSISDVVERRAILYKQQAAHYLDALLPFREHVKAMRIYGTDDEEDLKWLERVASATRAVFGFVFYRSKGAPYAKGKLYSPGNPLVEEGRADNAIAIEIFKDYYKRFGPAGPWVNQEIPDEVSRDNIRPWNL